MDILKYKGYEGTAELDTSRWTCRGKILFIDDLITYEAKLPVNLQLEFEAAVEDYIATCQALGRDPQQPLKGQFSVRVSPELHRAAVVKALKNDVSLNEFVRCAIEKDVTAPVIPEVVRHEHTVNHNYMISYESQSVDTPFSPKESTWQQYPKKPKLSVVK